MFLGQPAEIRRKNGRPIAHFTPLTWKEELLSIPKTISRPETLLIAIGLFSCGIPFSFYGSFNGSYYSARTRALANVNPPHPTADRALLTLCDSQFCYQTTYFWGTLCAAFACDSPRLGPRRRRAILVNLLSLFVNIATWSGIVYFVSTRHFNRKQPSPRVDWTDNGEFLKLLFLFIALGLSHALYQFYHIWLCSSLSNEPRKLGRLNGYISALRLTGAAASYGLDSYKVRFLVEAEIYFTLLMLGSILSLVAAYRYATDTNYGKEDLVITPEDKPSTDQASSTESRYGVGEPPQPVRPSKV